MGMRLARALLGRPVRQLSEYAHDVAASHQADGADLTVEPLAVGADDHARRLGRDLCADDLLREDVARPPAILRSDDRGELPAAAIADQALRRWIQPAHDPGRA